MKNKVLAMLLALCMVMSLLPVSVFAATYKCNCAHTGYSQGQKPANCTQTETQTDNEAEATAACAACLADPKCTACTGGNDCKLTSNTASDHKGNCPKADNGNGNGEGENGNQPQGPQQPQHSDANCALANDHSGPHKYLCTGCTLSTACTYSKHNGENACTELVDKYGDTCTGCQAAMAMAEAEQNAAANQPENRDCQANANNNAQRTNCQKETHESACAMRCDDGNATGCTLTKGHSGKHNDTSNCSKDAKCGKTSGHDVACPSWTAPADETQGNTTTRTAKASKTFKVSVTCACPNSNLHDHNLHTGVVVSGQHSSDPFDVEVTVYKTYTYEVAFTGTGDDKAEDKTATETARAAAEGQIDWTDVTPDENAVDAEDKVCDYCKAANAAKADADESKDYAKCNMTAECQKDNPNAKHNDDCLSLCTMSNSCENTAGDANAHVVKYRVLRTGTAYKNVVADQQGNITDEGVVDDDTPVADWSFDFLTYAQAKAYTLDNKATAVDQQGKRTVYAYEIRTVHCPKSGAVDSTVLTVEADGTTTETPETPAEENKTPTKAEEFTDMEDWMAEGVQFALDNKLMEGLGNGKFDGRTKVDAITVATVFARMAGETITGASWKDDAAAWVEENAELFEGIDLEGAELARKDVILVMWRQAGEPDSDQELDFTDIDGLEGDHLTAMKWAVENGIVKGNGDGTVSPDSGVSRGELCILLSRSASKSDK